MYFQGAFCVLILFSDFFLYFFSFVCAFVALGPEISFVTHRYEVVILRIGFKSARKALVPMLRRIVADVERVGLASGLKIATGALIPMLFCAALQNEVVVFFIFRVSAFANIVVRDVVVRLYESVRLSGVFKTACAFLNVGGGVLVVNENVFNLA